MQTQSEPTFDAPTIETVPPMRLAGLIERHSMAGGNRIPDQWQKFQPYLGNIEGGIGKAAYGVVGNVDEASGDFDYLCCVQVTNDAELPPELTSIRLPARQYAKFPHRGDITSIRATIHHAIAVWLPQSGRQASDDHACVEYYGPDFDGSTGRGTVEILLSLKA